MQAVVMALKLPVPSCNNGQTHCRRLIPTLLRSLLAEHWSAFGSPSRARSIMHVSTCSSLHIVVAGWPGS
ncbi:hypothetical protein J3E68DRAFT_412242 [Trichoderma sp. SZMC 28012]